LPLNKGLNLSQNQANAKLMTMAWV
jgi:hypothetical protein